MGKINVSAIFISLVISCSTFASQPSLAAVAVIAHLSQKNRWTRQDIRNLYAGVMKPRKLELLDQTEGQAARMEFYEKFITDNPNQIKQQRSILVFSGERAPEVLLDDQAVYE